MAKKETRVVVAGVPDEGGTLDISESVLEEIAVAEAAATDGVALAAATGRKGKARPPSAQGVSVQVDNQEAVFEISVGIRHGLRMPDVADALRQRIVSAVRAKTGYAVRAVNVVVTRVVREGAPPEAP